MSIWSGIKSLHRQVTPGLRRVGGIAGRAGWAATKRGARSGFNYGRSYAAQNYGIRLHRIKKTYASAGAARMAYLERKYGGKNLYNSGAGKATPYKRSYSRSAYRRYSRY